MRSVVKSRRTGRLRLWVGLLVVLVVAGMPAVVLAGHQPAAVPSYTGCLSPGGDLTDLAVGDVPRRPCGGNKTEVHLSGGDITGVLAGDGLTGGAIEGEATLAVNTRTIQARVTGTCAEGSSMREVAQDGSVVCESDDVGAAHNPQQVALLRWYEARQPALIETTNQNPTGVAFDGENIWVATSDPNTVVVNVRRASDGALLTTRVGDVGARRVAFDGELAWVTNIVTNTVNAYSLDQPHQSGPLRTVAVGNQPEGIAFDGTNIWVANHFDGTVTRFPPNAPFLKFSFPVGNGPSQIAFDGANIWVTNVLGGTVTKLRAADGVHLGTFPVGLAPDGIAFDGANIWVADELGNRVTKLSAADGANLGTFPVGDHPQAVAFDGANIWVANTGDDTVTKLRAADGAHLGTFSTGGDAPVGLAFDGAYMWVTNAGSQTVAKL